MTAAAANLSPHHTPPLLPSNLAVANLSIETLGVELFLVITLPRSPNMSWKAKSGCAEHHRAAVERMVNALPPFYLLAPCSGELFDSLEHCNRRLRGWALAEGFDIVRNGGGTKAIPSYRFRCIFHGSKTQNNRKLEDMVEKDA